MLSMTAWTTWSGDANDVDHAKLSRPYNNDVGSSMLVASLPVRCENRQHGRGHEAQSRHRPPAQVRRTWPRALWVDGTSWFQTGSGTRKARNVDDNGWPAEPERNGLVITAPFNAPSRGPPPWNLYRIEPRSAIVVSATEPGGLTRFRL
jgi:hypothetical protein